MGLHLEVTGAGGKDQMQEAQDVDMYELVCQMGSALRYQGTPRYYI